MIEAMNEKRQPGVIGSLPSTRPHRRSGKRAAPADPPGASAPNPAAPAAKVSPAARVKPPAKPEPTAAAAKPERAKPAAARTQAADRSRARTQAADRSRARAQAAARTPPPTSPPGAHERSGRASSPARDPAPAAPAPTTPGALQTALEATAELTEIGLRASARALRVALSRLPRP
jgi:hypothetical protein